MKLHANQGGAQRFTGYGADFVEINGVAYRSPLILTPEQRTDWSAKSFADLNENDFAVLLDLQPEIILLGTGSRIQFPHPALTRCLTDAQIGVDVMDNGALCRTFNILMAEDRKVVAAVLLG